MIADYIKNLNRYKGINANLDRAIDFLLTGDFDSLAASTKLDGDNVYVNKQTVTLTSEQDALWESHFDYMDIHVPLEGVNVVGYLNDESDVEFTDIRRESDAELSRSSVVAKKVELNSGMCAVLWPGEPHKPNLGEGSCLKLVVKVRIN